MEELRIQMSAKGPYTIKGYKVVVVDSEGNEIEKKAQWLFVAVDSPTRSRFVTVPTATVRPLSESLATDALFPLLTAARRTSVILPWQPGVRPRA